MRRARWAGRGGADARVAERVGCMKDCRGWWRGVAGDGGGVRQGWWRGAAGMAAALRAAERQHQLLARFTNTSAFPCDAPHHAPRTVIHTL